MKHFALLVISTLTLSACTMPDTSSHGHSGSGKMEQLNVRDMSSDTEISFVVLDNKTVFENYGISHTKEMHLIVVRDDLQYFHHLHPLRDTNNIWHVPFTAPAGGTYWLYADFVDSDGSAHTIKFNKLFTGDRGTYGLEQNFERTQAVDGHHITLATADTNTDISFSYNITKNGKPVELQEYLGAIGHSVLISDSGSFIHAHATINASGNPQFIVGKLEEDFYRAFTQFQIAEKVLTVSFDWSNQ